VRQKALSGTETYIEVSGQLQSFSNQPSFTAPSMQLVTHHVRYKLNYKLASCMDG
jgi:hypothetical protein